MSQHWQNPMQFQQQQAPVMMQQQEQPGAAPQAYVVCMVPVGYTPEAGGMMPMQGMPAGNGVNPGMFMMPQMGGQGMSAGAPAIQDDMRSRGRGQHSAGLHTQDGSYVGGLMQQQDQRFMGLSHMQQQPQGQLYQQQKRQQHQPQQQQQQQRRHQQDPSTPNSAGIEGNWRQAAVLHQAHQQSLDKETDKKRSAEQEQAADQSQWNANASAFVPSFHIPMDQAEPGSQQPMTPGVVDPQQQSYQIADQQNTGRKQILRNAPIQRNTGDTVPRVPTVPVGTNDQQPEATGQPMQNDKSAKVAHAWQAKTSAAPDWTVHHSTVSALNLESARMVQASGHSSGPTVEVLTDAPAKMSPIIRPIARPSVEATVLSPTNAVKTTTGSPLNAAAATFVPTPQRQFVVPSPKRTPTSADEVAARLSPMSLNSAAPMQVQEALLPPPESLASKAQQPAKPQDRSQQMVAPVLESSMGASGPPRWGASAMQQAQSAKTAPTSGVPPQTAPATEKAAAPAPKTGWGAVPKRPGLAPNLIPQAKPKPAQAPAPAEQAVAKQPVAEAKQAQAAPQAQQKQVAAPPAKAQAPAPAVQQPRVPGGGAATTQQPRIPGMPPAEQRQAPLPKARQAQQPQVQTKASVAPAPAGAGQPKWGAAAPQPAAAKKEEVKEEKKPDPKPIDWGDAPTLGAAKPKRGAKGAKAGEEPAAAAAPAAEKPDEKAFEKKFVGSAWGKAGEENRKKAAEEAAKAAEEAKIKAAEEAVKQAAEDARKAVEEAERLKAEEEEARVREEEARLRAEAEPAEAEQEEEDEEEEKADEEAPETFDDAVEEQRKDDDEEEEEEEEESDDAAAEEAAKASAARVKKAEEAAAAAEEAAAAKADEEASAAKAEAEVAKKEAEAAAAAEAKKQAEKKAAEAAAAAAAEEAEAKRKAEEDAAAAAEAERKAEEEAAEAEAKQKAEAAAAEEANSKKAQAEERKKERAEAVAAEAKKKAEAASAAAAAAEDKKRADAAAAEAAEEAAEAAAKKKAEAAAAAEAEKADAAVAAAAAQEAKEALRARRLAQKDGGAPAAQKDDAPKDADPWKEDDWEDDAPKKEAKEETAAKKESDAASDEEDDPWGDDDDWGGKDAKKTKDKPEQLPEAKAEPKGPAKAKVVLFPTSKKKVGLKKPSDPSKKEPVKEDEPAKEELVKEDATEEPAKLQEEAPTKMAPDEEEEEESAEEEGRDPALEDVSSFLKYRFLGSRAPRALSALIVKQDESGWVRPAEEEGPRRSEGAVGSTAVPSDRSMFGSHAFKDDEKRGDRRDRGGRDGRDRGGRGGRDNRDNGPREVLKQGANAYKIIDAKSLDREKELKRTCNSLLNKIAPDSVKIIASRVKLECKVETSEELGQVIGLIFRKALAEPHFCETYADLVYELKGEMPEFPNPEGGKAITFKSTLLNVCQGEFEAMPKTLAPTAEQVATMDPEEISFNQGAQKKSFLANMKFIGNLFLRALLTTKIIAGVMSDLMMCEADSAGGVPEEHVVECVCELLATIGYTLESSPIGQQAIVQVCGKMLEVKGAKKKDGKTGAMSKRIQFQIQDTLDMRKAGWTKKVFKTTAKTKEEIRLDAAAAEKNCKPGELKVAEYVIAGARPAYLAEGGAAPANGNGKPGGDWQDVKKPTRR